MIGVQLFGLRDLMKRDRSDTLQRLRSIGIEAVEPFLPLTKNNLKAFEAQFAEMRRFGFAVPSMHISPSLFGKDPRKISRDLLMIQERTGISVFVFSGMFSVEKAARKWGYLLGEIAKNVKNSGITILYHNHNMEFTPTENGRKTALDLFFDAAGPDVKLQLDIGWAGLAGDEIEVAKNYADRIMEIHCKDFYAGAKEKYTIYSMPKSMFAPIGEGFIKTREMLALCSHFPNFNGTVLIDQDHSAGDILEDIQLGFNNLKELFS